ncbi:MAG: ATP-binding protein, partial [Verrucomicrobiota bacterium]
LERRVAERTRELSRSNQNLEQEVAMRQRVQKELEAAELCYRTVANFTRDWEYWETPEHTLRYCSPSCERITGYTAMEFNEDPELLQKIIHPEDSALWLSHCEETLSLRDSSTIQFRICRKDGAVSWLEHVGQPVLGEDGAYLGIRACNRDITDRIEKDLQNQRLRDDLSNVGRVTTAGQLAASLAHELRQPLTAILCNVRATQQMLQSGNLDIVEVREALADIGADGERAGGVIKNLQAMFNKSAAEHRSISINALLQETVDLLRSEFVLQRVFVCLDFGAELPAVLGNHVELQQVILNLIFNAVESMANVSTASRRIHIRTRLEDRAGIRVSIQDSGPGIPEVQLSRMFEPFVTTKPSGMGMGLAICRTIIEAHGGGLWAANSPEGGAILEVVLQGQTGR